MRSEVFIVLLTVAALVSRLCPVDYHRFHFPTSGRAGPCHVINGPLFSVNPIALRKNIQIVEDGGDPMNTFRDAKEAEYVELPLERWPTMQGAERFTTYMMAQADEPPAQVAQIQKVLDSWAEQAKASIQ